MGYSSGQSNLLYITTLADTLFITILVTLPVACPSGCIAGGGLVGVFEPEMFWIRPGTRAAPAQWASQYGVLRSLSRTPSFLSAETIMSLPT